jgi:hypothetical protein
MQKPNRVLCSYHGASGPAPTLVNALKLKKLKKQNKKACKKVSHKPLHETVIRQASLFNPWPPSTPLPRRTTSPASRQALWLMRWFPARSLSRRLSKHAAASHRDDVAACCSNSTGTAVTSMHEISTPLPSRCSNFSSSRKCGEHCPRALPI